METENLSRGRQPQLTLTKRNVERLALPRRSSTAFNHVFVVRVVALPRPPFLGRFAAKTAAASALPHLFRSRNSVGLPSPYPPPGPQSFAVGICGVGTRLAVTTAQSGVAVNSQGTDYL
jgi:hypothetical protein